MNKPFCESTPVRDFVHLQDTRVNLDKPTHRTCEEYNNGFEGVFDAGLRDV